MCEIAGVDNAVRLPYPLEKVAPSCQKMSFGFLFASLCIDRDVSATVLSSQTFPRGHA